MHWHMHVLYDVLYDILQSMCVTAICCCIRYGHSQVNTHLFRFDKDWKVIPEGHLPLRDSYFAPERVINEGGIDPLLRGFVYQPAQEIDAKVLQFILLLTYY